MRACKLVAQAPAVFAGLSFRRGPYRPHPAPDPGSANRPSRRLALAVTAMLSVALAACATPAPILTDDVAGIRTGITAARQQAKDSFASADALAREQAVERKVRLPDQILREEDFPEPVPAAAAAKWDNAFDILDQYAAALQNLVDEKRSQQTGDTIASLGKALNDSTVLKAKVPAALTGIFSTFGEALVQASAERKATDIMRATDPTFHVVIGRMADAIGTPQEPGSLANDVQSQWDNSVLPLLENEYSLIPPADQDHRRKVIEAYTDAMAGRDKQLVDLAQLQRSLVALGEAHSAAAKGKPGDALFWIGRINSWADEIRTRAKAAEEAKK